MMTLSNYCESIRIWADDFDKADTETKKMILAHLIEKITVDKDYNLHIKFFIMGIPEKLTARSAPAER